MSEADGAGHAVVIGSGTAGLTAARALSRSLDRVTVIERDRMPRGTERRRNVPQARHTHTLMPAAEAGLERLFPGIGRELVAAGAVRVRMAKDMLVLGPAGWLPRWDSGTSLLSAGRDLVDAALRDRLRADPKVTFLHEHEVVALRPGRHSTVTGVWARARSRHEPGGLGPRRLLPAEFVVDACGASSPAPRWLAELGYDAPGETVVESGASYASTLLAPPVGHVATWKSLLFLAAPGTSPQGQLHPVEGGRWSVSLRCGAGQPLPTDHEGLVRASAALRHPLLHDVLATATPLGPVYTCARTRNRWRHYERLRRWPDQFLVLGDALATLDPAHGQGMTLAVESALVLDHMLASHGTVVGLSYRLRRALAHQVGATWRLSTRNVRLTAGDGDRDGGGGGDGDGGGGGTPGLRTRLARRSAARIEAAATTDEQAATLLLDQLQALAPRGPLGPRALWAAARATVRPPDRAAVPADAVAAPAAPVTPLTPRSRPTAHAARGNALENQWSWKRNSA